MQHKTHTYLHTPTVFSSLPLTHLQVQPPPQPPLAQLALLGSAPHEAVLRWQVIALCLSPTAALATCCCASRPSLACPPTTPTTMPLPF